MKNPNERDDEFVYLILAIIVLALITFLLDKYSENIAKVYGWFKIGETAPYAFWHSDWYESTMNVLYSGKKYTLKELSNFYNSFARFFWLPVFGFIIWQIFRRPTRADFKKNHTPESLLHNMSRVFSATAPFLYRDLTKENFNTGTWRLMETPLFFLVKNRCLFDPNNKPFKFHQIYDCGEHPSLYEDREPEQFLRPESHKKGIFDAFRIEKGHSDFVLPEVYMGTPEEEIQRFAASSLIPSVTSPYLNNRKRHVPNKIDENKLRTVLAKQLGEPIKKPFVFKEKWKIGLAVALFLHGYSDKTKKNAHYLLDTMNYSLMYKGPFDPEKVDVKHAPEITLNWRQDKFFMETVAPHMYWTNVFFMALLTYARKRGVVCNAHFGWVKAFDRTLWYALCQTGRQVACAEAAGVWSHYQAERIAKKPLETPYMEIAVQGFVAEMKAEGWLPFSREENADQMKKKQENLTNSQAMARGVR